MEFQMTLLGGGVGFLEAWEAQATAIAKLAAITRQSEFSLPATSL